MSTAVAGRGRNTPMEPSTACVASRATLLGRAKPMLVMPSQPFSKLMLFSKSGVTYPPDGLETVSCAAPDTPSEVATIDVTPALSALARPDPCTEATAGVLLDQVTVRP